MRETSSSGFTACSSATEGTDPASSRKALASNAGRPSTRRITLGECARRRAPGVLPVPRLAAALLIVLSGLAALAEPAQAQTATTFVSNLGQTDGTDVGEVSGTAPAAQQFTTGTATYGYYLSQVVVDIAQGSSTATASFAIYSSNASGNPDEKVVDLSGSIVTAGNITFTPAIATILRPSTQYFVWAATSSSTRIEL